VAVAVLAVAQLGRVEQEEELMKHLTQCGIGAMGLRAMAMGDWIEGLD
jgi:hypothetical protein